MFGGPDNPWICVSATAEQIAEAKAIGLDRPPENPIVSLKKEKEDEQDPTEANVTLVEGVPVIRSNPPGMNLTGPTGGGSSSSSGV